MVKHSQQNFSINNVYCDFKLHHLLLNKLHIFGVGVRLYEMCLSMKATDIPSVLGG